MKTLIFAGRNSKEILRDPLTLIFCGALPLALLILFAVIQQNLPVALFALNNITPAIIVFGFSFLSLFSGLLLCKDRGSAFLARLYASPLRTCDFIMGYALPMLPLALGQAVLCLLTAFCFGLTPAWTILPMLLVLLPAAVMFIGFGLLFGSVFNERQLGGVFTVFVNLAALLSGAWFDIGLLGRGFNIFCHILPFANAVDAARAALKGDTAAVWLPLIIITVYALAAAATSLYAFYLQKKTGK